MVIQIAGKICLPLARRQKVASHLNHVRQVDVIALAPSVINLGEGVVQAAAEIHDGSFRVRLQIFFRLTAKVILPLSHL